jgi:hypothetical protein
VRRTWQRAGELVSAGRLEHHLKLERVAGGTFPPGFDISANWRIAGRAWKYVCVILICRRGGHMRLLAQLTSTVLLLITFGVLSHAQAPDAVGYDNFMTMSGQERIGIFNDVSPSNRAALVREHLARWSSQNAARLTAAQRQLVDEVLHVINAEMYDTTHPERDKIMEEMKLFESRVEALFSVEDARQAFTIHGRHIPAQ